MTFPTCAGMLERPIAVGLYVVAAVVSFLDPESHMRVACTWVSLFEVGRSSQAQFEHVVKSGKSRMMLSSSLAVPFGSSPVPEKHVVGRPKVPLGWASAWAFLHHIRSG